MKANELRLGNWVLIPTNKEILIPCFPKQIKGITLFGELDFTEPTYRENHLVAAKHCTGIELTEEWVLKAGFNPKQGTEIKYFEFFGKSWIFIVKVIDARYTAWFDNGNGDMLLTDLKTVHQLQNLYFALTGEELEFKM